MWKIDLATTGAEPVALLPLVAQNYVGPPNYLLISKVFYLGSISTITGSDV